MKKIAGIIAASLILFACRRSVISVEDRVIGQWELRQSIGGIAGTLNFPPGNGYIIQFGPTNQYKSLSKTGPSTEGTYDLTRANASGDYILRLKFYYNGQTEESRDSIRIDGNKLLLLPSASCCDMATVIYEKLK